jgi:acyl-CoA dehydrogenase
VDEVHRQSVALLVLKDYKKPEGIYPTDHIPTRQKTAREKFAHLVEELTADA